MIVARGMEGQKVAVFGLARSGLAAIRALVAGGAEVLAWDDRDGARTEAARAGARVQPPEALDWSALASLVLSPGVPLTHPAPHPIVSAARAAGVEVIGDIELFARALGPKAERSARVIGITGTNGKSTTTALTGHLLNRLGCPARVGGNIGEAALGLEPAPAGGAYVLELSSYQLDLTQSLAPDAAALLNISPDHLDRHGDMAGYVAAKSRLFRGQGPSDVAVVGVDDPRAEGICAALGRLREGPRVVPVSIGRSVGSGIAVLGGILYDRTGPTVQTIADLNACPTLRGAHNWQNAAVAYGLCRPFLPDGARFEEAFLSFPGLAHRMEQVARIGATVYVNDSKATNADAAEKALLAFDRILWIAGGVPKEGGIEPLRPLFPRIAKAYLIGEAAPAFAKTLGEAVPHERCGTLAAAVRSAARDAAGAGAPVVLFSPACASFDQYPNFEVRGEHFRTLVGELLAAADPQKGTAACTP
ncbi:MAG: UDP-N-acetylmuramoyl-L-alanine--D-glutamate ligase [Alphaproteobacteria bacterium]|nr:UDP-N-acetylmuramoyl-L-alanine--D-glutamate ligase [Alphaproteobacteria bacterium]